MRDLNELRRKRGSIVAQMRSLTDTAEAEYKAAKRTSNALTAEEDAKYGAMDHDQEELRKEIEREERLLSLEKERETTDPTPMPKPEEERGKPKHPRESREYESAYRSYLASGLRNVTPQELRALQADSDTTGGYIVTPQQFITSLIKAVDDQVFIRQLATKFTVEKAESVGAPSLDTDIGDPEWTAEIKTGSEDSSMEFGKRELHPHPLARRIKVSNKLIRVSVLNIDALVRDRLAYKVAIIHERAFMNGSGAGQPLGLFTASDKGISTARDVSTGNTATSIGADNLFEMAYTLKGQYLGRPSTKWLFHRLALKIIRKLKDNNNQYLWQPGLTQGQPDMILGIGVINSEHVPSTFTTGQYVGILGDFSFYWIVDALDAAIQVLDQLYAETNQTGYIIRAESDGMPVLEEAFVRSKLA
jgi:HK97 family phage major capsid protein